MPKLYLVRHGRAAAAWDQDTDPGLDDLGREQAVAIAQLLASSGRPEVVVSPMRRTRETAAPLLEVLGTEPRIEPRVSEIPSPTEDLAARGQWLRTISMRRWSQLDPALQRWRDGVLRALAEIERDTVVVTHYIAINVAFGAATGDERVVCFHPDYCSVTTMTHDHGRLALLERGVEGRTKVL